MPPARNPASVDRAEIWATVCSAVVSCKAAGEATGGPLDTEQFVFAAGPASPAMRARYDRSRTSREAAD